MAHIHTDAEMLLATQLAYLNVNIYARRNSDPSNALTVNEIVDRLEAYYRGRDNLDALERSQLGTIENIRNMMAENHLEYCGDWKILDYCDKNTTTGFYAVTIDTGFGDTIVGFRGSETIEDMQQAVLDWAVADFGLLNSSLTEQQRNAQDYVRHVNETYYRGGNYQTISFTGHSLGGNLAEHAAITAEDDLLDKIDRATNWDGPGFSDEYIKQHTINGDIRDAADKIDHYQWSLVSSLLNPIPGSNTVNIESREEPTDKKFLGLEDWRLQRHHPKNVVFYNGDVKVIELDEADLYFRVMGPASRVLENTPAMKLIKCVPVIGTAVYFLNKLNQLVSIARLVDTAITNFVDDFVNDLKETAIELKKRYMHSKVSGVYAVTPSAVQSSCDAIDSCGSRMREISEEIRRISRSLPYDSFSGNYYRVKLLTLSAQVNSDGKKAIKCASAGREAAGILKQADKTVSGKFSG